MSGVTKGIQASVKNQNNWNEAACQKRTVAGIKKLKKMQQKYKNLGIDFSNVLVEPVKKSEAASSKKPSAKVSAKAKGAEKSKKQKDLKLEDLLGNTINEDSDDEDYVDQIEREGLSEETEEEDDDDDEDYDDDEEELDEQDDEDEDELKDTKPLKTGKKAQEKKTGAERLSNLLNRKPGTGGVQKKKSAASAKPSQKGAKNPLLLAAAKQIAKPLQKSKVGKKLKK